MTTPGMQGEVSPESMKKAASSAVGSPPDGSLDRFYLETDFSKGHLSQILRGQRSPSLATMAKLASALGVRVGVFFRPEDKGLPR